MLSADRPVRGSDRVFLRLYPQRHATESDGAEGLADVQILRAIEAAAETGETQSLTLPARPRHPDPGMAKRIEPTTRRLML